MGFFSFFSPFWASSPKGDEVLLNTGGICMSVPPSIPSLAKGLPEASLGLQEGYHLRPLWGWLTGTGSGLSLYHLKFVLNFCLGASVGCVVTPSLSRPNVTPRGRPCGHTLLKSVLCLYSVSMQWVIHLDASQD